MEQIDTRLYNLRINRISIKNVKCVSEGSIDFNIAEDLRVEKASILGIYGQNGSGKTVVIEVLTILKSIISGRQIQKQYIDSIRFGENQIDLEIEFAVISKEDKKDKTDCIVIYNCGLSRFGEKGENTIRNGIEIDESPEPGIVVQYEGLKVHGLINGTKYSMQNIAQTDKEQNLIRPKQKCKMLFGDNESVTKALQIKKVFTYFDSRSFIFSKPATDVIRSVESSDFGTIVLLIKHFAEEKLFIHDNDFQNGTPLTINFIDINKDEGIYGYIKFSLESKSVVPQRGVEIVESILPPLNLVLSNMFPGLNVKYRSQKSSLDEKDDNYEIELFASRNHGHEYSLKHESLGIKKIVSFLSLLIATYNVPNFVLAVDEFDSSVFEFLLGELISVMKESGSGQLIFTSHNLRPLERLDDTSICFTTTDPERRYIKLKKKASNNLRDMYFRIISLGTKDFELYNSKSKYALASALREAGWKE